MPTTTSPSPIDSLRREWFLTKLSFHLEDLPRRDRRAIYADLRADLTDAAREHGMRTAIADLGPSARLAHDYRAAQGRKLPRWWVGGLVAGFLAALLMFMLLAYSVGMLDAVASSDGAMTSADGSFFWTRVSVEYTPEALSSSFEGVGPLVGLVLTFATFFVAARGWRLWSRRP